MSLLPQPEEMAMEENKNKEERLEKELEEEELPIIVSLEEPCETPEDDDFEFVTLTEDLEAECMCAADDVFFKGQILPLRPSVSADGAFLPVSRSSSSATSSSGSSGSGNSSRSSSLGGGSSGQTEVLSRFPVNSSFPSYPSPKPGFSPAKRKVTATPAARPCWALLRLGLVRVPEINRNRPRRQAQEPIKKEVRSGKKTEKKGDEEKMKETTRQPWKRIGSRLRCGCSTGDAIVPEPIPRSNHSRRWKVVCSSRTVEWLAELPAVKSPAS